MIESNQAPPDDQLVSVSLRPSLTLTGLWLPLGVKTLKHRYHLSEKRREKQLQKLGLPLDMGINVLSVFVAGEDVLRLVSLDSGLAPYPAGFRLAPQYCAWGSLWPHRSPLRLPGSGSTH
ncbi:hypothetical protein DNTS_024397 [Danionella cerebrum]|uniref:Uncharacterized protein n=1 Tax=Danionella cerebrum TaxID=2873325 RepID=A0A553RKF3_9TELE|nr:hypothetical protein DNTS_024397 [Danionella translucida]